MAVRNTSLSLGALMMMSGCAVTPLEPPQIALMPDGQIITKIYTHSRRELGETVVEANLDHLITEAERRNILDIASLTILRKRASGGFWPDLRDKWHDVELLRGPPDKQKTNKGGEVYEYIIDKTFPGGKLVDNRIVCVSQGQVTGYAIYVEIEEGGARQHFRTSTGPRTACGRGRYAYFSTESDSAGEFAKLRANAQPPPGAKMSERRFGKFGKSTRYTYKSWKKN